MGRLCYWVLTVVVAMGCRVEASEASPDLENGPATTTVADRVYMADGSKAQGSLIITWPAFVTASGAGAMNFLNQLLRGISFIPALVSGIEGLFAGKSGAEKKDAAMSFLENAPATVDAVAQREIIDPEGFKNGISKILDGTVQCLNASTWAKGQASGLRHEARGNVLLLCLGLTRAKGGKSKPLTRGHGGTLREPTSCWLDSPQPFPLDRTSRLLRSKFRDSSSPSP
jgi:hypothetical protein